MTARVASNSIALPALDGTNPLGFLAALGVLATLRDAGDAAVRLGWRRTVTWTPVLEGLSAGNADALSRIVADRLRGKVVAAEAESVREETQSAFDAAAKAVNDKREEIKNRRLRGTERATALKTEVSPFEQARERQRRVWLDALDSAVRSPELAIGKHLNCTATEFRDRAIVLADQSTHADRAAVDLLTAFGSDAFIVGKEKVRIAATPFCFTTGSGHQYFLDTVRQLMELATPERVRAALFERWTYKDEGLSMRWDPLEDRRYALMDRDPTASGNRPQTVWMANLLGYRALVFFPSAPYGHHLATTAWRRIDGNLTLTWPVWETPADPDTVRSLLQCSELQAAAPNHDAIAARGIAAVFRARRIQVGQAPLLKINFSAARSV